MRKLCPNFDKEDGLETVLEVPIPEEMFGSSNKKWQNIMAWIRPIANAKSAAKALQAGRSYYSGKNTEIQLLLGGVGAPLIPIPIDDHPQPISSSLKDQPKEASMAKYIVQQYVAAVGGERSLKGVESLYAMGKVRMAVSEFEGSCDNNKKTLKAKSLRNGGGGEMGGFVLWKKRPDLWCLEMVVSGCKISAASDGKVAWRQTPWHHSHASRGPPRPLRRFLQGLDPKCTADLFSNSICMGEKMINNEDCFILKLEAESSSLRARSTFNVEIIRHTMWGYFSQRSGLLIQLEDSHLLQIRSSGVDNDIFWETTMVSTIRDYRTIESINIAHGGNTSVSLFRFGKNSENHNQTRMEEVWTIEEFDFNVNGLSLDCFLPPGDLKKEEEEERCVDNLRLPTKITPVSFRISGSKVVAIDTDDLSHIDYQEADYEW